MSRVYAGLVVLMISLSGCKTESEKALGEVVDKTKEVVTILKSVTDKNSAVAAKGKLQTVAKDFETLGKKYANKMARTDELKRAEEKFKVDMEQTSRDLEAEMKRIEKIPEAAEP